LLFLSFSLIKISSNICLLLYYSKNINAIPGSGFSTITSLIEKQKYVQYSYNIGMPFMFV
tara:strand:+ start:144 stop:323 length:180 start_codon:yes stop_codon:yes gene_type:complete